MTRHWKVGELAKLTGLTVRTLRFYDQIGLFSPSGQTESGHRLYAESDLPRLQQIVSLKEMGLSLDEVQAAMTGDRFRPHEIVDLQIERLKERIGRQQQLLEQLRHVSRRMAADAPVNVEDLTAVFQAMKASHEKLVDWRRTIWMSRLDALADWLTEDAAESAAENAAEEDTHFKEDNP
ncbi:MerR family transcriptional regulator [Cohnella fermenti]|uniref:MerR family transcriptional regulator n=1 Tax=Cohnella fermenti TaxID=2565925 RepID=A0A4S4C3A8_9BACL|nr:MerR family transcriptional regulator [Cohnella fermenti]THF82227.1 MerR family transcriptional regulator [Cohnella fermenti]